MIKKIGTAEKNKVAALEIEYQQLTPLATRMARCVRSELASLVAQNGISLAVPMEDRIKEWQSIADKLDRVSLNISSVLQINDLIGLRLITLFQSDIETLDKLIRATFTVVSVDNTFDRLNENQFGYQSMHYIVKLPDSWISIPSNKGLDVFKVEIQVRTIAQHVWAAASHKLQYKQEAGVPPSLRRAINRLSALLETVDLELERILSERISYISKQSSNPLQSEPLNVDIVKIILDENFPSENLGKDEIYSELLVDLFNLGVNNRQEFDSIIKKHKLSAMKQDSKRISEITEYDYEDYDPERISRGVFFQHVGLARLCLSEEFGDEILFEVMKR